ncbi:hypothetical protein PNOK_0174500 [Pyrrhoderma noxium]|uniref:Uncharacterized protein n=1 Tax=Pyrrhoderma noxium TaxID=2282107 RepID=A0A286UQB6_9AGAM|nr:hypothetical protein PNOK_0174500 [Pyrrhoderma noxium]
MEAETAQKPFSVENIKLCADIFFMEECMSVFLQIFFSFQPMENSTSLKLASLPRSISHVLDCPTTVHTMEVYNKIFLETPKRLTVIDLDFES